jgi:hypothetical protein
MNGWTPRAGLNWPIGRDSVTPASVAKHDSAALRPPSAASTNTPDFTSHARAALALSLEQKRGDALQAIIAEWMSSNPLACLAFLEGAAANDPMRASLSQFAIERWLAIDEARAREWVLSRVRSDDRISGFYLQPVFALAEKRGGFPELLALLSELPTSDNVYATLTPVVARAIVLKMDRVAAATFIRQLPNERDRNVYWVVLGSALARNRGAAILDQIAHDGTLDGLPAQVGIGAVSSLLRSDLVATGRWLARQPVAPPWDGERFNQGLLEMDASPELAIQTATLISDERFRNELYRHALSRWAAKDSAAATEWAAASSLPTELVAEALLRGQPIRDPVHYERALNAAAARAHDEKTRVRGQFVILQSWLAADAPTAKRWIAASDLPADAKQALLGLHP